MAKDIVQQYKSIENEYLTFVETDNVIPLLQEADVMVCDTSSVLIMFLLQGKPVVTFNNVSPKDYMLDISKPELLEKTIETALSYPKTLMLKVNEFIKETHPNQDGNSSERVLDQVEKMINGRERSLKRKPLNIIRSYKMRKDLNYWKF
jgi:CDP-glycerol glycerophosphotransferase (TagB/SpsB family)